MIQKSISLEYGIVSCFPIRRSLGDQKAVGAARVNLGEPRTFPITTPCSPQQRAPSPVLKVAPPLCHLLYIGARNLFIFGVRNLFSDPIGRWGGRQPWMQRASTWGALSLVLTGHYSWLVLCVRGLEPFPEVKRGLSSERCETEVVVCVNCWQVDGGPEGRGFSARQPGAR